MKDRLRRTPASHRIDLEGQEWVYSGRLAAAPTGRQVSDADHSWVSGRKRFPQFFYDHFLMFTSWRATSCATKCTKSTCAFVRFVNFDSLAHQGIFA